MNKIGNSIVETLPDLPNSWTWVEIDNVSSQEKNAIVDGPFGSNLKVSDYVSNGPIRVLTTKNLEGNYEDVRYISMEKFEELRRSEVRSGDILMAKIGSCGKTGIYPENMPSAIIPANLLKLTVNKRINRQFVYYYFDSLQFKTHLSKITKATAQPAFGVTNFKKLPFPLAPPVTQKIIVNKIEELFSHIDAGVEGLKQTKAKLQQYRQSVLKDAVTGKLTEKWREQNADKLEPADELLERILEERKACWEKKQLELYEIKGKLPKTEKWKDKYPIPKAINWLEELHPSHLNITLEHLKFYSIYGPRFSSNAYADDGALVLRTTDIDEHGRVNRETAPKLPLTDNEYKKYQVNKGDFLITRTGSIGTLAIYNDEYKAIPGAYLIHYKLVNKYVNSLYIYFVFKSPNYQALLMQSTTGIGIQNINAPTLESLEFLLPSLEEQNEVVGIVQEKLKYIEKCENDIEIALKRSSAQKASVLAKAFSGNLVPNDSSESAHELLEKIKAEKEKIITNKPKAKTNRKKKVTSERKPLLEVLSEQDEAVTPDVLMQQAGFTMVDIDDFYVELASIAEKIEQVLPESDDLKNWPYEKSANIKVKLKD